MKHNLIRYCRAFFALLLLLVVRTTALAQDGEILDIDIDLDGPEWYEKPIVWIGVAVFLLVLAFVARGRK